MYCAHPPAELTPLFPPIMSKQVYMMGVRVTNSRCGKNSSMKAFMNYLSSFELGFSLFKGFFSMRRCGPTSSIYRLNINIVGPSLLMCWQYVLYSVHRVLNVAGGVHNGRCTNIERMGIYAWRSI